MRAHWSMGGVTRLAQFITCPKPVTAVCVESMSNSASSKQTEQLCMCRSCINYILQASSDRTLHADFVRTPATVNTTVNTQFQTCALLVQMSRRPQRDRQAVLRTKCTPRPRCALSQGSTPSTSPTSLSLGPATGWSRTTFFATSLPWHLQRLVRWLMKWLMKCQGQQQQQRQSRAAGLV